jgi:diaminopimelate epimerase
MPPAFTKFHGFGNDYIVISASDLARAGIAEDKLSAFARRICDRHYGAGSDGIAVFEPLTEADADFRVRIFNPDGSEASLSGNGTRCAAAYLYYKKLWSQPTVRLRTLAGIKLYTLRDSNDRGWYLFDSELGQPKFDSASIPITTDPPLAQVIDYNIDVGGQSWPITAVQVGNPVSCIFVDDFDSLDWRMIGKQLEVHKQFPQRTNVVFVRVTSRQVIELRIWERGVGETEASGTCSCAAAVASMIKGKTDRQVEVFMPGGHARIQWMGQENSGEVVITGTAEVIYDGNWLAGQ